MEKIAENYYRFTERTQPSEGVCAELIVDHIDGEDFDTAVLLTGSFTVAGRQRKQFLAQLGQLIDRYRI